MWQITAKKRYARALAAVTDWCRTNRHQSIPDQHAHLLAEDAGPLCLLRHNGQLSSTKLVLPLRSARIWQKWLSRRGSRFPWDRFNALLKRHPLPRPRIVHRYTAVSEALP